MRPYRKKTLQTSLPIERYPYTTDKTECLSQLLRRGLGEKFRFSDLLIYWPQWANFLNNTLFVQTNKTKLICLKKEYPLLLHPSLRDYHPDISEGASCSGQLAMQLLQPCQVQRLAEHLSTVSVQFRVRTVKKVVHTSKEALSSCRWKDVSKEDQVVII